MNALDCILEGFSEAMHDFRKFVRPIWVLSLIVLIISEVTK